MFQASKGHRSHVDETRTVFRPGGFRGWEGTDREETKGYRTYCRLRGWEGTEREGTKGVLEDISGDAKGVSGDTAGFRGCIGFWLSWVGVINERWFDDF